MRLAARGGPGGHPVHGWSRRRAGRSRCRWGMETGYFMHANWSATGCDWQLIEQARSAQWMAQKAAMTPSAAMELAGACITVFGIGWRWKSASTGRRNRLPHLLRQTIDPARWGRRFRLPFQGPQSTVGI